MQSLVINNATELDALVTELNITNLAANASHQDKLDACVVALAALGDNDKVNEALKNAFPTGYADSADAINDIVNKLTIDITGTIHGGLKAGQVEIIRNGTKLAVTPVSRTKQKPAIAVKNKLVELDSAKLTEELGPKDYFGQGNDPLGSDDNHKVVITAYTAEGTEVEFTYTKRQFHGKKAQRLFGALHTEGAAMHLPKSLFDADANFIADGEKLFKINGLSIDPELDQTYLDTADSTLTVVKRAIADGIVTADCISKTTVRRNGAEVEVDAVILKYTAKAVFRFRSLGDEAGSASSAVFAGEKKRQALKQDKLVVEVEFAQEAKVKDFQFNKANASLVKEMETAAMSKLDTRVEYYTGKGYSIADAIAMAKALG